MSATTVAANAELDALRRATRWNFADEILAEQRAYRQLAGKFVIPVPKAVVL